MHFDRFDRRHLDDPDPVYRELRAQQKLHFSPEAHAFCVTRYDEAAAVFKQPKFFSSRPGFNFFFRDRWVSRRSGASMS